MPDLESQTVIITGASSGIGEATARLLAARGARVALAARRRERLEALAAEISEAGGVALACPTDVTDRAAVAALADEVMAQWGRIDVLVANAGVMPLSPLAAGMVDDWERMIDVNVKGVLYGLAAVLPLMLARGQGHVVTMASVGAHLVAPAASVYCATKFAAWAIAEGLRQEAAGVVRSTTVSPGAVATDLPAAITVPETAAATKAFYADAIDAAAVARAVLYALEQPEDVAVNEVVLRPSRQAL